MVDLITVGVGTAVVTAAAGAYHGLRRWGADDVTVEDAPTSSYDDWAEDTDDYPEGEFDYTIENDELPETHVVDDVTFTEDETEILPGEEEVDVNEDIENQADPLPDHVADMEDITEITGVGNAKAQNLHEAGFETPEDVFYASDENLTNVTGIGPAVVEQIRDDVGYLEAPA